MKAHFSSTEFYRELESSLPASNMEIRKVWVTTIIEQGVDLKTLSGLLRCEQKVASRFLWLLSEIGLSDPNRLLSELPFLWNFCDQLNPIYKQSFASFWLIAGVPIENEGVAIEYLFQWLLSTDTNVTIKSRVVLVLFKLTEKYPELKNELRLCLQDQMTKYSKDFEKRVSKILLKIED
ncbi:hypothetical protein [Fluviicola sp.]|uniref:hypothetical protein n=1 Tax=Fluviicola sp. TaxID=1917219 RepID=UPI0026289E0E|nr:hypothetical protein [Fluviicola sp.]